MIHLPLVFLNLLQFYIRHNIRYQAHVFCRPLESFLFLVLFGFVSLLSLLSTETKQVAQVQSRKHDEQVESHNMQSQLQLLFASEQAAL